MIPIVQRTGIAVMSPITNKTMPSMIIISP
jgi:hypothetical protein